MTFVFKLSKICGGCLVGAILFCASTEAEVPRRGLEQWVQLALEQSPEVQEAKAKVDLAEARRKKTVALGTPQGSVELGFGMAPDASGNAVEGETDWSNLGPSLLAKLQLFQPIYTFGALSSAKRAGELGLQAEAKAFEKTKLDLRAQIEEIYFGFQLAFELTSFLESVLETLDKALAAAGKSGARVTRLDRAKLESAKWDVVARLAEAQKMLPVLKEAMAWKTGISEEARWDVASLAAPRTFDVQELSEAKTLAKKARPEYQALDLEWRAKSEAARAEAASRLPAFGVVAGLQWAHTPHRQKADSPFAYDPLNGLGGHVALGVQWKFGDWGATRAKSRAEALQAQFRRDHWTRALDAEMVQLREGLIAAKKMWEARSSGARVAKKAYQDAFSSYALGSGSAKDALEALALWGGARKSELESIHGFWLAHARWRRATGSSL